MSVDLTHRHHQPEWMDGPNVDPEELHRALKFIRRINTLLGYTRATLHHLKRFSRSWRPGEQITIADVATGSADMPRAIARWADRAGFDVRIVGIDLHAETAAVAAKEASQLRHGRLTILRADAMNLPLADGSVDYALTAMFLHHLSEDEVVTVLRELNRVARRGVIVADLLRHRRALMWIRLLTLAASPMVRHDAAVSIEQSFSEPEILALRNAAGLEYAAFHQHFGHRFVLAGEKKT